MLPALYRPAVSYLRVVRDTILLFYMYYLLCPLLFHNYVILCLFSGWGGRFSSLWVGVTLLLLGFLQIASLCG